MSRERFRQAPPAFVAMRAAMTAATLAALTVQQAGAQAPAPQAPVYVGERWVCRPADSANAANTVMMGSGGQQMHCRSENVTITASDGRVYVVGKPQADGSGDTERISVTSPSSSATMTVQDLNQNWVDMMRKALVVDDTGSTNVANIGDRWVCRPQDASNPANASMSSPSGSVALHCRAVNLSIHTSGGMIVIGHVQAKRPSTSPKDDTSEQTGSMTTPPYDKGLTADQLNRSWNNYVYRVFDIATSAAGGG
jgi:hypothetical protein